MGQKFEFSNRTTGRQGDNAIEQGDTELSDCPAAPRAAS